MIERVLLDTQVLFLAYAGELNKLPKRVLAIMGDSDTECIVSSASIVEMAVKHLAGKMRMDEQMTREAVRDLRLAVLPFDVRHALRMFSLPLHHRDPFDRMILATALVEKLPLVSGDRAFRRYGDVELIW